MTFQIPNGPWAESIRAIAREVERLQREKYGQGADVRIGLPDTLLVRGVRQQRLILTAPDGSAWQVSVDNAGALSTTAV